MNYNAIVQQERAPDRTELLSVVRTWAHPSAARRAATWTSDTADRNRGFTGFPAHSFRAGLHPAQIEWPVAVN